MHSTFESTNLFQNLLFLGGLSLQAGVCDIEKKRISRLFWGIFPIAESVVQISDYPGQLQFLIFLIFRVVRSHQ